MKSFSYRDELLNQYRERQDDLADAVIDTYFPDNKIALQSILSSVVDNGWKPSAEAPKILYRLWEDVYKNDVLQDSGLQYAGQQFFSKNSSDLMLLLGFLSLPYCYAAAKGAEVLVRSNRIKDEPEKRLLETAEFVFDVMAPNAFGPDGKGLASILKVRLMHATIRYYIGKDSSWDASFGKPINQEDQAGTNLSFSLIPIRGLRQLGRTVSAQESQNYIRYWNVIGRLLGVHPDLLPETNKAANVLERKIRKRHFASSEAGRTLTESLLKYFVKATRWSELEGKSTPFVEFLLGESVSSLLGVKTDTLSKRLFEPVPQLMKLKNILLSKDDQYVNSLNRFKEQKAIMEGEITFDLPPSIDGP